jgi:hypothetical protein
MRSFLTLSKYVVFSHILLSLNILDYKIYNIWLILKNQHFAYRVQEYVLSDHQSKTWTQ